MTNRKRRIENKPLFRQTLLARAYAWKQNVERLVAIRPQFVEKDERVRMQKAQLAHTAQVVHDSIEQYFHKRAHAFSAYSQARYFHRVLEELEEEVIKGDNADLPDRIHGVLLYLNFNARPYNLSYIHHISDQMKLIESPDARLEALYAHRKIISQVQCERGLKYYDLYPSVRDFIGGWLTAEIDFLERRLSRHASKDVMPSEYFPDGRSIKLLLDMSVARLACLMRALVDKGIVQNTSVTDLSLLMTKFVTTKRSENLSPRSFRLRYYDIEDSTKDGVVDLLKELIKSLKQGQ